MKYYKGVAFEPDEKGIAKRVYCPLIDEMIEAIECLENQDIRAAFIPKKFKCKDNWQDICFKCPFRDY